MNHQSHWNKLRNEPEFTSDWCTHRIPLWKQLFPSLAGRPGVRMLEIGSHEGRSALWWLNNVLTHDSSELICIDPWKGRSRKAELRFDRNIAASGLSLKVRKIKSESRRALHWFTDERFDAIYIDGSHEGCDVLLDALLALNLVKPGGFLLFDDYRLGPQSYCRHPPQPALDTFLKLCDWRIEILHREYQLVVRRRI